ncbi:MAG: hypothetical protein WC477_06180 [Patescibacteria group bacterium]
MKLELPRIQRIKTGKRLVVAFEIPATREVEYAALILKGQPSDLYDVTISTLRRKRTTGWKSQNHRLNSHVMQIANETGQPFEDVKLFVKRRAIARGLPLMTRPNGDIVYSLTDKEPLAMSEADMDTVQCGYVIDEINILAGELGIVLREE